MNRNQATIKDIGRELGISFSTVSRALSKHPRVSALVAEKTRKRVRQKAAEMDYSPNLMAQGIVTGKTGTLGLLTYEISHGTYASQTDQILRVSDKHKYQILMAMTTHRERRISLDEQARQIRQLISRGIDGLLIQTRGDGQESDRIPEAVRGLVPVVTYHYPTRHLSRVVLDDIAGFCDATEHLIRLGHERIGFIGSNWNKTFMGSEKGKGYLLAMLKHGLNPRRIPGESFPEKPTHRMGKRLGDRFTAVVCRDDYTAIGACRGLREAGLRVPEDVAVVGNGDVEVRAYLTPALTTLATPCEAIAQAAMELMLEQLQGLDTPRQITLKSPLVIRESCGAKRR